MEVKPKFLKTKEKNMTENTKFQLSIGLIVTIFIVILFSFHYDKKDFVTKLEIENDSLKQVQLLTLDDYIVSNIFTETTQIDGTLYLMDRNNPQQTRYILDSNLVQMIWIQTSKYEMEKTRKL